MEPPDFEALNITAQPTPFTHPVCTRWRDGAEGSVFHLANIFLFLGFMGGSGLYGVLYLFTFLTMGFFCSTLWSWSDPCTTDTFLWTFALFGASLGQTLHVSYRLRSVTFEKEFEDLYNFIFKKLGVSLTQFGKIVESCERDVQTLEKDHCFAVEGKTAIDKLSVLLTGRIRVTVNGEFLHHIYPFQFLDSPEWDSLRPSEEGTFQVTLRAENRCRYVTWRRKRLYLLFAKHRYLAKIFALVVRNDIADKLYSLNDKAFDSCGHRYDLRLPSFCHSPDPPSDPAQGLLHPHNPPTGQAQGLLHPPDPPAGQAQGLLHPTDPPADQVQGLLHPPDPPADLAHDQMPQPHSSADRDRAEGLLYLPDTPTDQSQGLMLPPDPSADQDRGEGLSGGQRYQPEPTANRDRAQALLHAPDRKQDRDRAEGLLYPPDPSADQAQGQLHPPDPSADRAQGQLHPPDPSADRAQGQLHPPDPSADQDRAQGLVHPTEQDKPGTQLYPVPPRRRTGQNRGAPSATPAHRGGSGQGRGAAAGDQQRTA